MKKYVFVNKHEYLNMVKDYQKILKIKKNLESYLVKFKKDRSIKTKNYLNNYAVGSIIYQLIIVYIFFTNNRI